MSIKDLETRRAIIAAENNDLARQKQFYVSRNYSNLANIVQDKIDENNKAIESIDRRIENAFNYG